MRSTSQMRTFWSPPCVNRLGVMRAAYQALDNVLRKYGYVLHQDQTGACNCRRITGGTGYSLHAYFDGERFAFWNGVTVTMGVAVDINWRLNPYGRTLVTNMPRAMVEEILAIRTVDGLQVWGWGGNYSSMKDAMHYELQVSPAELARGIRGSAPVLPPPTGKCGDPAGHPTLRLGAKGPAVNHLQHFLIISGARIPGDGDFGPRTDSAVRNHQTWLRDARKEPVVVDGIVGPKTWQAIHNWADGLKV